MELFTVDPRYIDFAWKDGAEKLAQATSRAAREITSDQLKLLLARGERQLMGVREPGGSPLAWIVTTVNQLPNVRVLYIWELYGPGAAGHETFRLLAEYARANGCSAIRAACDEKVERVLARRFGARKLYSVFEVDV